MNQSTSFKPKPSFMRRVLNHLDGVIARDPAAKNRLEVLLLYPSVHAVGLHQLSHWLYQKRFFIIARFVSQMGRFLTGIEIHPGAVIGERLFIDHGMGVVIGETAQLHDDVTIYHGVTLGGVSPAENSSQQRSKKRHPTLETGVIIGSGAQILGSITIGQHAKVGANAVVVQSVAADDTVIGIPAYSVKQEKQASKPQGFTAYGTPTHMQNDCGPAEKRIKQLEAKIRRMQTDKKPSSAKTKRETS